MFGESPYDKIKYSAPTYFLMTLFNKYRQYDYMWVVEFDVCYSGDWSVFFSRMNRKSCDLICERLMSKSDDPTWCWWEMSYIPECSWKSSYKALNCIARVSRNLHKELDKFYSIYGEGRGVFFERAWATAAVNTGSCLDIYDSLCDPSFSFSRARLESAVTKDRLYHAVKDNICWQDYVK